MPTTLELSTILAVLTIIMRPYDAAYPGQIKWRQVSYLEEISCVLTEGKSSEIENCRIEFGIHLVYMLSAMVQGCMRCVLA